MPEPRTLPQPLGQVDCLILQCLERLNGRYPIRVRDLLWQLNERELADVGIGRPELVERLDQLHAYELVTHCRGQAAKITRAGLDILRAAPGENSQVEGLDRQAPEIRQSPAGTVSGGSSSGRLDVPFAPDGAGDEWGSAA